MPTIQNDINEALDDCCKLLLFLCFNKIILFLYFKIVSSFCFKMDTSDECQEMMLKLLKDVRCFSRVDDTTLHIIPVRYILVNAKHCPTLKLLRKQYKCDLRNCFSYSTPTRIENFDLNVHEQRCVSAVFLKNRTITEKNIQKKLTWKSYIISFFV